MNPIHKARIIICLLSCFLLGTSCSKSDHGIASKGNEKGEHQADVYMTGYEINTAGKLSAVYWKNSVKTVLSGGTGDAAAYAITVVGDDIYVAGGTTNAAGKTVATIWKNETPVALTDGTTSEIAYCLFAEGNDVYAGGFSVSGVMGPKVWKNGKLHYSFPTGTLNQLGSIKVANGDIFITGANQGDGYWQITAKDQIKKTLKAGFVANSIYLAGRDIYVCGGNGDEMTYFKNKTEFKAKGGKMESFGNAIYVDEDKDDVYVTGWLYPEGSPERVAGVWKNGEPSVLPSTFKNGIGYDLCVWNQKLFVVGAANNNVGVLWEDGKEKVLTENGVVHSICVVERK